MILPSQISHLTFDCYGTLIDWETGILAATQPLLQRLGVRPVPEAILKSYVCHEARLESPPWRPYRKILSGVMTGIAGDFGVKLTGDEPDTIAESLPAWPAFPDTVASLQRLATRFRLAILSNTDETLFAQTQQRLPVQFADVITAERVRSYKPGSAHFTAALRRLGVPATSVLHVASSLHHDHVPAHALGFKTAWIQRPSRLAETGLAPVAMVESDSKFSDLASLATFLMPVGE